MIVPAIPPAGYRPGLCADESPETAAARPPGAGSGVAGTVARDGPMNSGKFSRIEYCFATFVMQTSDQ
jgi:hypothetical protein